MDDVISERNSKESAGRYGYKSQYNHARIIKATIHRRIGSQISIG